MKCLFVSDIHGKAKRFEKLFEIISFEKPDGVFLGGDLLPNHLEINVDMQNFVKNNIFTKIKKSRDETKKKIRFFVILGNDDPRVFEKLFLDADKKGLIDYVHNKTVNFNEFFVTGYSYVPPTPFQLKDWEKYDVSRYVDVGAISPEEGIRTIDVDNDKIQHSTISEDLKKISENAPVEKTIFLFHSPPYKSLLDRAGVDNKKVDHAPIDVHVGSIAIQRFIKKRQPLLTLHGHVHETVRLTGNWRERNGKTYSFSAAHDGPELAVIRFDTKDLENASRELIKTF